MMLVFFFRNNNNNNQHLNSIKADQGQCSRALLLRPTVAICVHLPEDLVCALLWCGLIFGHLHHRRNHLVDSLNRAKARGRHFRRKARNTKVGGRRLH